MKTKKYRKNTKKRYSNFSRKSKGGMYTDSDDDDDGVMKFALALSKLDIGSSRGESSQAGPSRKDPSPVRPSSREESSDDEQLREAIDASIKSHLEDQKRKQEEEDAKLAQRLQKQEADDFETAEQELADIEQTDLNIALQKSLTANKDWLHPTLTLYQYWDTANWVKNLTIPHDEWIGSSAQPVKSIVPTKCHTGLHLGNVEVPNCERQWSGKYRYTDQGRSSINDCGACMFTGLGYQLEHMSSTVPGMTNWELMRTTYGLPGGIPYMFIDGALNASVYTRRALMKYITPGPHGRMTETGRVLIGTPIHERLFVFPRMFPDDWSDLGNQHNLVNIITLIAKAVMPNMTMMGITLHIGDHVMNGFITDIRENVGHYTNLYRDSRGNIFVYDIQYESYKMMGDRTLSNLDEYIRKFIPGDRKLISMGIIVAPEVANWFNNNILPYAPPKLVRWSSLPGNNPLASFNRGGKMTKKKKAKKKSKKYKYLKVRSYNSRKYVKKTRKI